MFDGSAARTGVDEVSNCVTELAELRQLSLDRCELLLGSRANGPTRRPSSRTEREELLRLGQGEAEPCSVANELKPSDRLFAVAAIATLRTASPRQEADALVVANGLDANSRAPRENADREGPLAHADSMEAVPDYGVKGLVLPRPQAAASLLGRER